MPASARHRPGTPAVRPTRPGWWAALAGCAALAATVALAGCKSRDRDRREPRGGSAVPRPDAGPVATCKPGEHVCDGDQVRLCGADGVPGGVLQSCKDGCTRGNCTDTCAVRDVELIYVIDTNADLLSFDPRKLPDDPFRRIGRLTCDPATQPFSMAVDRRGIAWVLYNDGSLYRVSILDAHCAPAGLRRPPDASITFGMGFVSDGPDTDTEQLFVAGNDDVRDLATVDTSNEPAIWHRVGTVEARQRHNPELTGTGDGSLFGYFPEQGAGFVQELDRASGRARGRRLELAGTTGFVDAWAFAHWGGVFFVFVTVDGNSTIHAVSRKTGRHRLLREGLPYVIVGAGVSTCAPLLEVTP